MHGRGSLTLTGQMGEVMQESAKAAMSYVRSQAKEFGLDENFYRKYDVHIHVPEGAVPKDGPSAGVTIATALTSALTKIPVRRDVAMTGEITLRGKVLPIGGLKEKLLAARRAGIKNVIMPFENKKDFEEIRKEIPEDMNFYFAKEANEVIKIALAEEIMKKKEGRGEDKDKGNEPLKYLPGSEPPQMYA
jgi:ATP-dependent Lon protease